MNPRKDSELTTRIEVERFSVVSGRPFEEVVATIKCGFDMLTHAKSVLVSPPDVAIEHLFPPFTPEKNAELKLWFDY